MFANLQVQLKSGDETNVDAQKRFNELAAELSEVDDVYAVEVEQLFETKFRDGDPR